MMRHIFCILLITLVIGCQSRRTSSVQSGPTLEISDETLTEGTSDTIRFGRLHSGETGIKRFRLQNTSSRTWVVARYEVSCECVTPEFDRRPLKPGEEIPFSVRFDSRGSRYGFTSKPMSIKKLLIRRKEAPNGCDSRKFRLYLPENPTEAAEIRIARYIRRHLRQVRISIGKHRFGKNGRQHSNNLVRYPAFTIFVPIIKKNQISNQ